ncbi:MAG TPA: ABC-2 transporter permease [Steroidobacteraceae bacterium]
MKSLQVQIRREFWEHRSLWIAPLAVAAALLAAAAAAAFGHSLLVHVDLNDGPTSAAGGAPLPLFDFLQSGLSIAFYVTAAILASIYFLDCLYGERRDRSILFWKSLPVSNTQTVLVKFLVGLVILPLGTFLLAALTGVLGSAILALRNHAAIHADLPVWNTMTWLRLQAVMLYTLIATLCWYAPYAAYLMLASAWARRSPYVWALIPPILLAILERMIFGTNYVSHIIGRSFSELMNLAFHANAQVSLPGRSRLISSSPDPAALLASPQLWLGLAAAAMMLALAIRLRRYRDDS